MSRATIRDVAEAAGVSIKTVSRVLNKERYVSAATRERVEAAVAALSFHPSLAARALAGRRSFQIALVCDNPSPYYLFEVQAGIRDRAAADGVRVIVQPYDRGSPSLAADIVALIDQTHPDGLILTPPVTDHPQVLDELARRATPFARISPGCHPELAPSVRIDNEAAAGEVVRHLIGLGHVRIGLIVGDPAYATSAQRRAGYVRAMAEAGLAADPMLIRAGRYDFASGAAAAAALLALSDPPTAIFASSDDMAAGVLAEAHRRGLSLPRDLSVAGFDDAALAGYVWPPLTTMRQPVRALGREAADLLLGGAGTEEHRVLPHELVIRGSTARPAERG